MPSRPRQPQPIHHEAMALKVGNTIDKTMAGAIVERTYPRLTRFTIDIAAMATVAVLRTVTSTPPLLTADGNPPARPRLAVGLPLDTATLHATFGHALRDVLRATCAAYNLPVPARTPSGKNPQRESPAKSPAW